MFQAAADKVMAALTRRAEELRDGLEETAFELKAGDESKPGAQAFPSVEIAMSLRDAAKVSRSVVYSVRRDKQGCSIVRGAGAGTVEVLKWKRPPAHPDVGKAVADLESFLAAMLRELEREAAKRYDPDDDGT